MATWTQGPTDTFSGPSVDGSVDSSADVSSDAPAPVVITATDETVVDGALAIEDGSWMLYADFTRSGPDLILSGPDGQQLVIRDYFTLDVPPDLVSADGVVIKGGQVDALSGPLAPGAYADASGSAGQMSDAGVVEDVVELASVTEPIGRVTSADGEVTVTRADGSREVLEAGDSVFQGDTVETGDGGGIGIEFADESTFSLGEGGRMVLDEFVYDPVAQEGDLGISLVEGAFSFVSGHIAKTEPEAMRIDTPTSTIGIRGTAGGGMVDGEGVTAATLMPEVGFVGEMVIANEAGSQTVNQPGQTISIASSAQAPSPPFELTAQQMGGLFGDALGNLPNAAAAIPQDVVAGADEGFEERVEAEAAVAEAEAAVAEAAAGAEAAEAAAAEAEAAVAEAEAAVAEAAAEAEAAAAEAEALAEVAAAATGAEAEAAAAAAEAAAAEAAAAEAAAATAAAEAATAEAAAASAAAEAAAATAAVAEAELQVAEAEVAATVSSPVGVVVSAASNAGIEVPGAAQVAAVQANLETVSAATEAATAAAAEAQVQAEAAQAEAVEAQAQAEAAQAAAPEAAPEAEAAPEGEGEAEAAPEGEGEAEAAPEGEGEAEAAPEGEGEAEAAPEGEGEAEAAPEGEGEAEAAPEGEAEATEAVAETVEAEATEAAEAAAPAAEAAEAAAEPAAATQEAVAEVAEAAAEPAAATQEAAPEAAPEAAAEPAAATQEAAPAAEAAPAPAPAPAPTPVAAAPAPVAAPVAAPAPAFTVVVPTVPVAAVSAPVVAEEPVVAPPPPPPPTPPEATDDTLKKVYMGESISFTNDQLLANDDNVGAGDNVVVTMDDSTDGSTLLGTGTEWMFTPGSLGTKTLSYTVTNSDGSATASIEVDVIEAHGGAYGNRNPIDLTDNPEMEVVQYIRPGAGFNNNDNRLDNDPGWSSEGDVIKGFVQGRDKIVFDTDSGYFAQFDDNDDGLIKGNTTPIGRYDSRDGATGDYEVIFLDTDENLGSGADAKKAGNALNIDAIGLGLNKDSGKAIFVIHNEPSPGAGTTDSSIFLFNGFDRGGNQNDYADEHEITFLARVEGVELQVDDIWFHSNEADVVAV